MTSLLNLAIGADKLTVPLGFFTLFLGPKLNLTFALSHWIPAIIVQLFFSLILYALTGWVSGFLSAIAYNFVSQHFDVRLDGTTDAPTRSDY